MTTGVTTVPAAGRADTTAEPTGLSDPRPGPDGPDEDGLLRRSGRLT